MKAWSLPSEPMTTATVTVHSSVPLGVLALVEIRDFERIAEETFDLGGFLFEVAGRRLLGGLQEDRAGEDATVGQRLDEFDRLVFTALGADADPGLVSFRSAVEVGVHYFQEESFADVDRRHVLLIFRVGAGKLAVGDEPAAGGDRRGTAGPADVVVDHFNDIRAVQVEHFGDERLVAHLARIVPLVLRHHRPADEVARHGGGERDQRLTFLAAQLHDDLAGEAPFLEGGAVAVVVIVRAEPAVVEDALDFNLRAAAGLENDRHLAAAVLGRVAVDDFDGEGRFEGDAGDGLGVGFDGWPR